MTEPGDGSRTVTRVAPVIPHVFTDMMEQLQQGYVAAVAATSGCSVEFTHRDNYGYDALITRQTERSREEVSLKVALKNTTQIKPDPGKANFSYQFHHRQHLERLTMPRTAPKMILLVMVTPRLQTAWTEADHEYLKVHHCCYWAYLENRAVADGVQQPSVSIETANVFDSIALTEIMDKLDRGESLL